MFIVIVHFQTSTMDFITGGQGARQYADEGDEIEIHQLNAEPQRSFDLLEESSSDSNDDGLMTDAPPEYYDIVQDSPIPVSMETDQLTTRVSVYTGSTDTPPYVGEAAQQQQQQQLQQQQQQQQQQQVLTIHQRPVH